jgi:hypothetical protein
MSALASTPAVAADKLSTATAAPVYVVAIVAAARLGGFVAGASASLLSFVALNYFFTPPLGTFNVDKAEDLVGGYSNARCRRPNRNLEARPQALGRDDRRREAARGDHRLPGRSFVAQCSR